MAPAPDVELLVEAHAGIGGSRPVAMLEAGDPVNKPSDRKPSARRRKTAAE
jgi:uroporphyrinogen III methyltransferase/synthase